MPPTKPYVYYAADISYFSGITRPALPQKNLHYRESLPDINLIQEKTGLGFIPVLLTPEGEAWQDTSEILDQLEERHPDPPLYPATPVQRIVAYLVELYGNELGILPAMHYRWGFEESKQKVLHDFGNQGVPAAATAALSQKMSTSLPFLGVNEATAPEIEGHLHDLLAALSAHFEEHRFLLGDAMSLGDCGLMGPLYGHLFRDAVPERLLYETAGPVCQWIERMNRPPLDQTGWLPEDTLAATLGEVLRVMAEGVPLLLAALRMIDDWADANIDQPGPLPPAVGLAQAAYRGLASRLGARPYSLWMVQRSLDAYAGLSTTGREQVEISLAGTGWEELLAYSPRHRLGKWDRQLFWEE